MTLHAPSTRRDRRYPLPPGAGIVELPPGPGRPERLEAPLTRISVAGIAFLIEAGAAPLPPGSILRGARVRVGECVLEGEVSVRDAYPVAGKGIEVGAIFLPESRDVESRLMALLAGIRLAHAE